MNVLAKSLISIILSISLAPVLFGLINRVKARFAGRKGQPILQPYYDIWRLLQKGIVYSSTTSWVFRIGSLISFSGIICALAMIPIGPFPPLISFDGDIFLVVYLLGAARFMTIISALDTGSSFEGMGASREAFFSALAEPAFLLSLMALAKITDAFSLSAMVSKLSADVWFFKGTSLALVIAALFIVLLSENARIPVDDPNTHLELTMIHEVMVLDHSGPDFAAINYGSAIKLLISAAIITPILFPLHNGNLFADFSIWLSGMFIIAVAVGIVESTIARLRLTVVPQFLLGATVLAVTALVLTWI